MQSPVIDKIRETTFHGKEHQSLTCVKFLAAALQYEPGVLIQIAKRFPVLNRLSYFRQTLVLLTQGAHTG